MKGIMLCGGDLRQVGAANALVQRGYNVLTYMVVPSALLSDKVVVCTRPRFEECDAVILPLPCSADDRHLNCTSAEKPVLEELFSFMNERHRVYGGKLTPYIKGLADRQGIELFDYLSDESFSIKNAYLTAEGAIQLALQQSQRALFGTNALVIGFGRIGKCLARLLKGMGAHVTVAARKPSDRAWISNYGCTPCPVTALPEQLETAQMIFNTVPVQLLSPSEIPDQSLYMELASKPYGTDLEQAAALGKNVLLAASLPGKVTPITAGEIIADTVINSENSRREEKG